MFIKVNCLPEINENICKLWLVGIISNNIDLCICLYVSQERFQTNVGME